MTRQPFPSEDDSSGSVPKRGDALQGTLYGVGVGPGDPELLTLKAARILGEVPVVAVPVARANGDSYALDIAARWLRPGHRVLRLHFSMSRELAERHDHRRAAAQAVIEELQAGRDVAFITEGDPLLHSTFIYLLQALPDDAPIDIVPGISSMNAAAAQARLPLVSGGQRLAVVPAAFESLADLRHIFGDFDTVVLLKFQAVLNPVLDLLDELGLIDQAVVVERASHASGRVIRDLSALRGSPVHYLSVLIVRTRRDTREALAPGAMKSAGQTGLATDDDRRTEAGSFA